MVFSSLFFLFVFLPVTIIVTLIAGQRFRNLVLLLCSLFFYAWGEGAYVLIMLGSIGVNYAAGLLVAKREKKPSAKIALTLGVSANLLLLAVFKYTNFFVDNINGLAGLFSWPAIDVATVHLPIGISFFTFQAISYLVDIYTRNAGAPKNIIQVGLYISMFPQLIAGPIVRFHDISQQLSHRVIRSDDVALGIRRFMLGLGKKVLIANTIAATVDQIFMIPAHDLPMMIAWLGAIGYSLQIFFDFSGYSDMAIGLGRIFGFTYLENFNYPYISRSVREFWRRWHISLSTWFRDYLYFPLGGSRCGSLRTYMNLLTVFLLCGMWHGASWNFIVWGLIHGTFICFEKMGLEKKMATWPRAFQHVYTVAIILCSWVFFRAENLSAAMAYLKAMVGITPGAPLKYHLWMYMNFELFLAFFFGVLFSTPVALLWRSKIGQKVAGRDSGELLQSPEYRLVWQLAGTVSLFAIFGLSVISLASGAYNPFIYFRF